MGHYASEMCEEGYFSLKERLFKNECNWNRRIDKIMSILRKEEPEQFTEKTMFLGKECIHPLLEVHIRVGVQMNLEQYEEKYKDKL